MEARYQRNILIPGFGHAGQERLRGAKVAIVGLGGLGSPAGLYLAAAGVGTLGLFDSDHIELSNLQRQVLHPTSRLGQSKAASAVETLAAINPEISLTPNHVRITPQNTESLLTPFDAVVEASDNFETKYLLNDACLALGKPLATAGILSLSGQGMFIVPGKTACLRCLVAEPPQGIPTTSELGVLGAIPGMLGSLEALEIIRWLVGIWKPQPDGAVLLHSVDGDTMRLRTLRAPRRAGCRCAPLWKSS